MFDVISYLESLSINSQSRSHGHYLYIDCPDCGGSEPHLWINVGDESRPHAAWGCWKDQSHHGGPKRLVMHLEKVGWQEAEVRLLRFDSDISGELGENYAYRDQALQLMAPEEIKEITAPDIRNSPANKHLMVQYLRTRGFGRKEVSDWGLRYSVLWRYAGRRYKYRIYIPIEFQGKLVGFQARDVTDRQKAKYLSSPGLPKSRILYNADRVDPRLVVVTEGPLDAWAVGREHGVCIFGKKISAVQARVLCEVIGAERVVVALDGEAYGEAEAMAMDLVGSVPRVDVLELPYGEDPASLGYKKMREMIDE